jgi:hypothetical protein
MNLARSSVLTAVIALSSLPIVAGAWAQTTPQAWTPLARSPLRQIWSFDTKG